MLNPLRSEDEAFRFLLYAIAVIVVIAGLSARLTMRDASHGYGRLMKKDLARNNEIRRQPPPMIATPVMEQTSADPLLVAPAAREQEFLSVAPRGTGSAVNITGDSSGITIVRSSEAPKRPLLAGGIFKQPAQ